MQNKKLIFAIVAIIILVIIGIVGFFAYQYFKKPELGDYLMQRPIQQQNTNVQNSNNQDQTLLTATPISGSKPLQVKFSGVVDFKIHNQTIVLDFGETQQNYCAVGLTGTKGSDIYTVNPEYHTYKNTGTYIAKLRVGENCSGPAVCCTPGEIISTVKIIVSQSQDQTAAWKTYTNDKLGISIDYPSSWTYQEYSCNIDGVAFCPQKSGVTGCGQTCSMNSPGAPIYFVIDMWNNSKDKQKSFSLSDTKYQDIYNQMLSSFKFNPTAGWKTYSGYGISFQYPASMGTPTVNQLSTRTEIGFGHMAESFSIGIYYDQNLGRVKTFDEVVSDAEKNSNVINLQRQNITVGGKSGIKIIYTDATTGGGTTEIYVPSGDAQGDILMAYEYGRGTVAEGLTVSIEQILPTFKFTK